MNLPTIFADMAPIWPIAAAMTAGVVVAGVAATAGVAFLGAWLVRRSRPQGGPRPPEGSPTA